MKRVILYIGIALAAIGCTKDNTMTFTPSDGAINFNAEETSRVADNDDCAWKVDDEIGIFTDQSGEENLFFKVDNTTTGAMSGDITIYKLASGTRNYYAYHPYDANLQTTSMNFDCTTDASSPLLWATKTSNEENVSFQFSHKLVKLQFSLIAVGIVVPSFENATARLAGANAKAIFDIETGEFSELSVDDIALTVSDNTITAYVPPMESVNGNVKLYISINEESFVETITTDSWESGNCYNYNITVDGTQVKVGSLYYSDNTFSDAILSDKTPIGVVIHAGEVYNTILSLVEYEATAWSSVEVETLGNDSSNGLYNMRMVNAKDGSFTNYAAFKLVHDRNSSEGRSTNSYADNTTNVWYLPAKDELGYARVSGSTSLVQDAISNAISSAGAVALSGSYWTSTEFIETEAWDTDGHYGNTAAWRFCCGSDSGTHYNLKQYSFKVRPVMLHKF